MKTGFTTITLKHLYINDQKQIGLYYPTNQRVDRIIKSLPAAVWSEEFSMYYLPNKPKNVSLLFDSLKDPGEIVASSSRFFKPALYSSDF